MPFAFHLHSRQNAEVTCHALPIQRISSAAWCHHLATWPLITSDVADEMCWVGSAWHITSTFCLELRWNTNGVWAEYYYISFHIFRPLGLTMSCSNLLSLLVFMVLLLIIDPGMRSYRFNLFISFIIKPTLPLVKVRILLRTDLEHYPVWRGSFLIIPPKEGYNCLRSLN